MLRAKATAALNSGSSLFVSEWGTVNADGNGAVDLAQTGKWQALLRQNCFSQANWAVSDKSEGASLFKPGASSTGPWKDKDLIDSVKLVRKLVRSWKVSCK